MHTGSIGPAGSLGLTVVRGGKPQVVAPLRPTIWPDDRELTASEVIEYGAPQAGLPAEVNVWRRRNLKNLWRGARRVFLARSLNLPHFYGSLFLTVYRGDGSIVDLGLASLRVVTDAGVKFICDDFNTNTTDVTNMKFHGFGTGTTAEAATQTALVTELTTQYAVDNTRPTGSQASAGTTGSATYTTVATLSPDTGGTIAITEHGIFHQASNAGGTLLDRSVFSAVNLVAASDSLQATYVLTVNSGS